MGKVKRLELWWQLYRTSFPVWDMDFCWHECTRRQLMKRLNTRMYQGVLFPLNGRPTCERGKLIPLDSYSCSKVTALASAEWPRKWQFSLSVKLLSCAIRILERTDEKRNGDGIANPFITYLWLVFLPLIRSDFDGKHFWRVFTVTVLSFHLYTFRVHKGELQPSDVIL